MQPQELFSQAEAKAKDDSGIAGRPIGREALLADLAGELIPYSPEELMELAEKEIDPAERHQAEQRARAHWLVALGELELAVEAIHLLGRISDGAAPLQYQGFPDAGHVAG